MKVACLGMVSAIAEPYIDKKTGMPVRSISVAAGDQMLNIKLLPEQEFAEFDSVLVAGELKMFERRMYIEAAKIRLSTAEDRAFFANPAIPIPPPGVAFPVQPLGTVTDKAGKVS